MSALNVGNPAQGRQRARREEMYVEEQALVGQLERLRRAEIFQESKVLQDLAEMQRANDHAREVMASALRLTDLSGRCIDELTRIVKAHGVGVAA